MRDHLFPIIFTIPSGLAVGSYQLKSIILAGAMEHHPHGDEIVFNAAGFLKNPENMVLQTGIGNRECGRLSTVFVRSVIGTYDYLGCEFYDHFMMVVLYAFILGF